MAEPTLLDLLWIGICAGLVLLMQAGFLCLETGMTRRKNNISVAIKNVLDLGLATLLFFLVGFGLMFGRGSSLVGLSDFAPLLNEPATAAFFLFQLMLCGTAVTIISGAAAERLRVISYLLITSLVGLMVYPIVGHWVWGGALSDGSAGWLQALGFYDFAGATVVHSVGGWAALAVLLVIGPRQGRFATAGGARPLQGANIPFASLGILLLTVGWFGFNGGGELALTQRTPAIMANTILASAGSLTICAAISLLRHRQIRVELVLTGPLAGLVAITAGANVVTSYAALLIGAGGGLAMLLVAALLRRYQIDDAVGAVPVHLGAGLWGSLAVALFGQLELLPSGLNRIQQIGMQLLGISATAIYVCLTLLALLWLINRFYKLRVSQEAESVGLNVAEHGASSELADFYRVLEAQAASGALNQRVPVEPFSEVGQIAQRYNEVMDKLQTTTQTSNAILSSAMDAIMAVDIGRMEVTIANPMAGSIFASSEIDLLGQSVHDLMTTEFEESDQPADLKIAFEGAILGQNAIELQGRRANGDAFPLEVSVANTKLDARAHFVLTMRDITDRVAADNAIRDTQLRLQTVVRNAPLILFVLDADGRMLLAEGRAMGPIGLEQRAMLGRRFSDVFMGMPKMVDNVAAALAGEERRWQLKMASRYIDHTAVPIYDDYGTLSGVLGVSVDVTERVEAEASQRRFIELLAAGAQIAEQISVILDSEELLRVVVELLKEKLDFYHVQIFALDDDGQGLTSVGASGRLGESLRAYGAHQIPLAHPSSINARAARSQKIIVINDIDQEKKVLIHPLLSNTRSELSIPLMAQGKLVGVLDIQDMRVNRFGQAEIYLFSNLAGMIANSLANANLFEERQLQAQLLAKQEARSRALYEITTLAGLTLEQQFITALATACEILSLETGVITRVADNQLQFEFRYDPRERLPLSNSQPLRQSYSIAALRLENIVASHDVAKSPLRLLPAYEKLGAAAYLGIPLWIGGELFGTLDFLNAEKRAPFTESDKNFVRLLSEWITATLERDLGAKALASARDEAIEANEFKTELLAKVSHELKTPLGVIIGYAELLHDGRYGPVNENQRHKSTKIIDSARYLAELVSELLDLSRSIAGTLTMEYQPAEPKSLIANISDELRPMVEEKGLRFEVIFDTTTPDRIVTDAAKMRQIITNLVTNATKFTPHGFIRIAVQGAADECWQLMIEDSGIGIRPEQQDIIFEPFKQVDGSPTKEQGGAGLGLAIVKQIVEQMGGDITLASEEGRGTCFLIRVPVVPPQEEIDDIERRRNKASDGEPQLAHGPGR